MPYLQTISISVLLLGLLAGIPSGVHAQDGSARPKPLSYSVSWIGNTFPGGDQWVQNHISEVDVTADGTVYASSGWDEAGRCVGAYKDGQVNRRLFKQYDGKGGHKAWGWGTAGSAVAADEKHLYLVNTEGELLRFRRDDSGYVDQTSVGKAVDMTAREGMLYIILETGEIQLRTVTDFSVVHSFKVPGAADVAVAKNGVIWLRVGKEIRAFDPDGTPRSESITGLENPSDISIAHDGRLIVCDNGSRCQVLFYNIDAAPKLDAEFGKRGGLRAGTPGVVEGEPLKLFAIRGAGTDAEGNLYVALGKNMSIIRKFNRKKDLVWEVQSLFFVDATSVLPSSDGGKIYGREEIFTFDYKAPPCTRAWKLRAITADFDRQPDDARKDPAGMGRVRLVDGHRLLFVSGMMAGPMSVFYFDSKSNGEIALDSGLRKGDGWAACSDSKGGIWYVSKESKIIHEPLTGFAVEGKPIYGNAKSISIPKEFRTVERIAYDPDNDTMILTGFTRDNPDPGGAWGLVGTEILAYDHWSKEPRLRWRTKVPFKTWEKGGGHEMIMPKCIDIAGDYLFVCYVLRGEGEGNNPPVRIYRRDDGSFVGELRPGGVVGIDHGWVDIVQGMSAFKRSNGEYVILVEEDYKGKNVLYRWMPDPKTPR